MKNEKWISTSKQLPPERVVVETKGQNQTIQRLKRIENLWFIPDGSIYVYYTPIEWRLLPSGQNLHV